MAVIRASGFSLLGAGKVEITELDSALQFVGVFANKKDVRTMGVDAPNRLAIMGARILQECNDPILIMTRGIHTIAIDFCIRHHLPCGLSEVLSMGEPH